MSTKERFIIILLLTITGSVLILSGAHYYNKTNKIVATGIEQQGTIIAIIEDYSLLVPVQHVQYIPVIQYRDMDGNYNTFRASYPLDISSYSAGDKISIYYNPESGEAVVNKFSFLWLRTITCFSASLVIILGMIVIIIKTRNLNRYSQNQKE